MKAQKTTICTELILKEFEVIATFDNGSICAFLNCRLDDFGQCDRYVSPFSGEIVPAEKVKRDEQWRNDNWSDLFDAVAKVLRET